MALEGKIKDFGVVDILQLISQQQKTGMLLIEKGKENVVVTFWNGMIVNTQPASLVEQERSGYKWVRTGILTEEQLKSALKKQKEEGRFLGEILVASGLLSREVLDHTVHNQIYDAFTELFQWKEGSYSFHPQQIEFNESIYSPLGLEHILLDVLRMIDEWPEIEKKIPDHKSVLKRPFDDLPPEQEKDLFAKFTGEQEVVYGLVDGHSSLNDIIEKSLLSRFATLKSIAVLLENGIVEVIREELNITQPKIKSIISADKVLSISSYALLIAVVVLVFSFPPNIKESLGLFAGGFDSLGFQCASLDDIRAQKIRNALKLFYWETGKYPEQLNELVQADLLHDHEVNRARGEMFSYQFQGATYQLSR